MIKSLKKWASTVALVGASFLPMPGYSDPISTNQDFVSIEHNLNKGTDAVATSLKMNRYKIGTEGKDASPYDVVFGYPGTRSGKWAPKAVTHVGGYDLSTDTRPTNSFTDFNFDFSVVIQDNQSFIGTNKLGVSVSENSTYKYIPTNENWTISYNINPSYYTGGAPRTDKKNVRDLCPVTNVVYYWTNSAGQGVGINIPKSATNSVGEVVFGSGTLHKEFNKLVSSSAGSGTNSPNGTQIVNYNSVNTVGLNANEGSFVDKYVVARDDGIGNITVTTNDILGQDVASTNVTILGMGSNSVSAVYGRKQFPVNVAKSGSGSGNSSWTNGVSQWGDSTNVNFNAGAHSGLSAILVNGVVNRTFNPATNSYNFITEPITNAQTITGVFDLEKFLVSAAAGRNGSVGQAQAEVAYGGSTSVVYTADAGFKTGKIYVDGNLVSSGGNLEERVSVNNVTGNRNVSGEFKAILLADGTPEWFRIQNGLAAGDLSKQDTDRDGVSDGDEFIGGTDPTNATSQNSQFRIDGINCANGAVQITYFGTSRGREYGAEFKPTLTNIGWQVLTNKMTGNGGDRSLTLTFPDGNTGFFQGTMNTNEQASELIEYTINTQLGGTGDGSISPRRARVIDGESTNIVVRAVDADRAIAEVRKNNVVIPEAAGQVVQIVPFENMTVNNQTVTAVVNDLYDSHGIPYWRYTGSGLKHPGEVVTAKMEGDVDDPDDDGDPDHDGFVNWIELKAGKHPLDPESYPGDNNN
jgi:hypothetical protein